MMTSYFITEIFIIETDPANRSHQIDVTLAELCISDKVTDMHICNYTCSLVIDNNYGCNMSPCTISFIKYVIISLSFIKLKQIPNQYYYTTIFFVIFLPMLIAFLWLNGVIAKEIWHRRHPISAATKPKLQTTGATALSGVDDGVVNNVVFNPTVSDNDEQSTDKRTSETNTISNGCKNCLAIF